MNEALIELVVYGGGTAVMLLIAWIVYMSTAGKRRAGAEMLKAGWDETARSLGGSFFPAAPGAAAHPGHIKGEIGHLGLWIGVGERDGKKVTSFRASFQRPLPIEFAVVASSHKTASPIKTGDARFDQCFSVSSRDPEAILELLTPELRAALVELDAHRPTPRVDTVALELRPDGLDYHKLGLLGAPSGLGLCAEKVLATAKLVDAIFYAQRNDPAHVDALHEVGRGVG